MLLLSNIYDRLNIITIGVKNMLVSSFGYLNKSSEVSRTDASNIKSHVANQGLVSVNDSYKKEPKNVKQDVSGGKRLNVIA